MRARDGFTLVELGIILAVIAVGMAYVAPDFVEMARGELSTRAAKEMSNITNASKWYYMNASRDPAFDHPIDRNKLRWPGEGEPVRCVQKGFPHDPESELIAGQYLEASAFTNPWGNPYDLSLQLGAGGTWESCKLVIATNVPETVAGEIKTYMPMAVCDKVDGAGACPGGAPAGQDRCCAKIVRPGQEATLQEWIQPANMCDIMMGGELDPGTGKCDVRGDWDFTICHASKTNCRDGYVAVGNYRVGCGKYCQETWLRCCKGEMP